MNSVLPYTEPSERRWVGGVGGWSLRAYWTPPRGVWLNLYHHRRLTVFVVWRFALYVFSPAGEPTP
ncbi:MAG: hypothetical protein ACYC3F_16835 [Gemmatimonadaceae bacterium]